MKPPFVKVKLFIGKWSGWAGGVALLQMEKIAILCGQGSKLEVDGNSNVVRET